MHTGARTGCGGLAERRGMLSATAGTGHHTAIGLLGSCIVLRRHLTLGNTSGRSQSCKKKSQPARDRGTEYENLDPDTVHFHSDPRTPIFKPDLTGLTMDAAHDRRVGCQT